MSQIVPLLQVEGLACDYLLPRRSVFGPRPRFRAVDGVSFVLRRAESFGLVGESGCGKSTLARAVMALERPSSGRVVFAGEDLYQLSPTALKQRRRGFQMVFQDPYGSLDPRLRVGRIVAEPLESLRAAGATPQSRREQVADALQAVGLSPQDAQRFPHEFSGGQRQRIAIARALITRPALIVADEPVSALDVSVQAQVLNLMMDLQEELGLSYLFIGHDLGVMRHVTDRIAVMYRGRIVEQGATKEIFTAPRHPYTETLLASVPSPRTRWKRPAARHKADVVGQTIDHQTIDHQTIAHQTIAGEVGCAFAPRCPLAEARCRRRAPELRALAPGREVACHLV